MTPRDHPPVTPDLFADLAPSEAESEQIAEGAVVLRRLAVPVEQVVMSAIDAVIERAPLRHWITPGGFRMSVAMTNCGERGWVSDRTGYRYTVADPASGEPWPAMPSALRALAREAAARAGFAAFEPDACLINRYEPGTRLSLHQDKDERDFAAPIVSVSLGLPATFLFGGPRRKDRPLRVPLGHGDVVVWGGPARLWYHGVSPLKPGVHPITGAARINLTFRKAG